MATISIESIVGKLKEIIDRNGPSYLTDEPYKVYLEMLNSGAGKTEVVVSFLAVLELMRMGKVMVEQESFDQDLDVEVSENADLENIDLSDLVDE